MRTDKIQTGRPRIQVDFAIVLRLRDEQYLGWSKMAEAYQKITGQYISRDTIKRRYLEANARDGDANKTKKEDLNGVQECQS